MHWPATPATSRQLRLTEERRLLYVALTRAERTLLFSGHHWGPATAKPAGPSEFLLECAAFAEPFAEPDAWAPPPDPQDAAVMAPRSAPWPVDPLGGRRPAVVAGADLVLGALADLAHPAGLGEPARSGDAMNAESVGAGPDRPEAEDPFGWASDVTTLLAERSAARPRGPRRRAPGNDHRDVVGGIGRRPGRTRPPAEPSGAHRVVGTAAPGQ